MLSITIVFLTDSSSELSIRMITSSDMSSTVIAVDSENPSFLIFPAIVVVVVVVVVETIVSRRFNIEDK